jgi:hypothetical protein
MGPLVASLLPALQRNTLILLCRLRSFGKFSSR